jgi:hypothetical protein
MISLPNNNELLKDLEPVFLDQYTAFLIMNSLFTSKQYDSVVDVYERFLKCEGKKMEKKLDTYLARNDEKSLADMKKRFGLLRLATAALLEMVSLHYI